MGISLEEQISAINIVNRIYKNPLSLAIEASLKELSGIKKNRVELEIKKQAENNGK
jgi:hypothetical protein